MVLWLRLARARCGLMWHVDTSTRHDPLPSGPVVLGASGVNINCAAWSVFPALAALAAARFSFPALAALATARLSGLGFTRS